MDTRQKIIDATITVLNEDFSAPLDRIAEKTGLSRRTLHRYFTDRGDLIDACREDMMQTWQTAMLQACDSTQDPLIQLERMLYAGIDCGVRYVFLHKLLSHPDEDKAGYSRQNPSYETTRDNWFQLIPALQRRQLISEHVNATWIRLLFIQMISVTVQAYQSGDIAQNDIKKLAWYSFRRSIGME
ncbi:transcriptional regulator, TetR family [Chitinophaga sp. YR627]|uniref:TetR/AcrR family transcriptional regulator n=1 Tax=Chitinophaga sp. YR627 TaxID=1881041 RepID=UPI0008F01C05|nr:TetR/AcrR family transcriptional regulator [Chitinophaga sp. YR627]SFM99144.1 transcriptional regulator, TetR family [Chitinophaga sp. YR627]